MKIILTASLAALLLVIALSASGTSQTPTAKIEGRKPSGNPDDARLITADIANFWRAYDQATPENRVTVFENEYLKKGSYGLEQFVKLRIKDAASLVKVIESHPKYYASIRESTLRVETMKEPIRASFYKLKDLYPNAVFPDVYFLIGRMSTGGTTSDKGLLIGVEMFSLTEPAPKEELNAWHQQVLHSIEILPAIVAHELIHYQQKNSPPHPSLLHQALCEGSADFIAEFIADGNFNAHLHEYGRTRELELWLEFQREMDGKDFSHWLYNAGQSKQRPADLGYFIGYKIAEAYYQQAANKKQAIKEILTYKDAKQFLLASKYAEKFEKKAKSPDPH